MACITKCYYDHSISEDQKYFSTKETIENFLILEMTRTYKLLELDTSESLKPHVLKKDAPDSQEYLQKRPWILRKHYKTYDAFRTEFLGRGGRYSDPNQNYNRYWENVVTITDNCIKPPILIENTRFFRRSKSYFNIEALYKLNFDFS